MNASIYFEHNISNYYIMTYIPYNYYRLYLGNLPTNITSNAVKDEFPKATRVDIGFAKKMKYTR